jgi:hypothetical protein
LLLPALITFGTDRANPDATELLINVRRSIAMICFLSFYWRTKTANFKYGRFTNHPIVFRHLI